MVACVHMRPAQEPVARLLLVASLTHMTAAHIRAHDEALNVCSRPNVGDFVLSCRLACERERQNLLPERCKRVRDDIEEDM